MSSGKITVAQFYLDPILMIDGAYDYSTKQRREKGMSSKISFPCPQSVKGYNKGRGGVDLLD